MTKKLLSLVNHDYGVIGESVGYGLFVGDIVTCCYKERIHASVIVKSEEKEFLMGFGGTSINDILTKHNGVKIISYQLLTNELLLEIRNGDNFLYIEDVDYVEITQAEIENKLGYKIKIIND